MERLSARDVSAVMSFASELRDVHDPLAFSPRVIELLRDLIHSEEAGYSELDQAGRFSRLQVWTWDGGDEVASGRCAISPDPDVVRLWWDLYDTHPVCSYRKRTGAWTAALKMSDFVTRDELHATPMYDHFWRGHMEHQFAFGLAPRGSVTRIFLFSRLEGRDFSERDRLVGELVRPHLERRAREAEAAVDAAAAMAAVEDGASEEARLVVLCSPRGVIEFASVSARRLLRRYAGVDNGRLPAELLSRPELVLAEGEGRLTIRVARAGALRLLLLSERDLRVEHLTRRERDVLDRVARGQTNAEIAIELAIATATVAKHLEHIYEKLGVRSRTAAARFVER